MNPRKVIFLNILVLAFIAGTGIFYSFAGDSYQATVEDISGDRYLPAVKEVLKNAKTSIDMAMYFVNFDPQAGSSPVNGLVEELVNAHKRGVKVRVILDQNIDFAALNKADAWQKEEKNNALFVYLKKQGIEAPLN